MTVFLLFPFMVNTNIKWNNGNGYTNRQTGSKDNHK